VSVSVTVSGQVTGRYDVFVSGFSVFGWSATHWKWIPGRAALARNDRNGRHAADPIKFIPGPTKVIPDLIRNPDLAEGVRVSVSETVSGQVTGRYDVFVSGFSVFGWSATHWKWIPGRAALARNDRNGRHAADPIKFIPGPTKVIPDLIRNPDLAEGVRVSVSETVSGQVTGRYDVFVSGFSVFGWSATHWKWIPGRAVLARNDRKGSHAGP